MITAAFIVGGFILMTKKEYDLFGIIVVVLTLMIHFL